MEIAIITGHPSRGIKADREVARQLEELKEKFGFEEVVLVSDGADDEQLIPVIQGITRIANIQRVVIKQSQAIESSFYLLKEVLKDPHFARIIFGLPGIALVIYAIVYLLGIERLSFNVIIGLIGAYLIMKGFGIEDSIMKWLSSFKKTTSIERASFPLYISSLLVILLAIWSGMDASNYFSRQLAVLGESNTVIPAIAFISGALGLLTLAILLFFAGRIVDMYHRGEVLQIRRYARSLVTTIAAYLILEVAIKFFIAWTSRLISGPTFLDILIMVILAVLITFLGFSLIAGIYKKLIVRHIKKGMIVKRDGKEIGKVAGVDGKKGIIHITTEEKRISIPITKIEFLGQGEIEIL